MRTSNTFSWPKSILLLLGCMIIAFLATPAFSADAPIAKLTSFSGTVIVKSQGSWAIDPEENLPLYSLDKVVTRVGTAVITFNDGTVLELRNNTNLLIQEGEEEEGLVQKTKVLKRRITMFLGKLLFRTGKGRAKNFLQTPTAVCGLRGTSGGIGIGEDFKSYIQFTTGGAVSVLGFIEGQGLPPDVSQAWADAHPIQRASFVAYAAAQQAVSAQLALQKGEISDPQAAWWAARAAQLAALEVIAWAQAVIDSHPSPDLVALFEQLKALAEAARQVAEDAMAEAVANGATEFPIPEPFEPEEGVGFDLPTTEEPVLELEASTP